MSSAHFFPITIFLFLCCSCWSAKATDQELSYDVHLFLADVAALMPAKAGKSEHLENAAAKKVSQKHAAVPTFVQEHGHPEQWEKMFAQEGHGFVLKKEYASNFGTKMRQLLLEHFGKVAVEQDKEQDKHDSAEHDLLLIKLFTFCTELLEHINNKEEKSGLKKLLFFQGKMVPKHFDYTLLGSWLTHYLKEVHGLQEEIKDRIHDAITNVKDSVVTLMRKLVNGALKAAGEVKESKKKMLQNIHSLSWSSFSALFGRTFANLAELRQRFIAFEKNKLDVLKHNMQKKVSTYKKGINKFSDWTIDELKRFTGFDNGKTADIKNRETFEENKIVKEKQYFGKQNGLKLKEKVDWREEGIVTPVKYQGTKDGCGACWAFAATATLESHVALRNKNKGKQQQQQQLVTFSEQQCLDCSSMYWSKEHEGGGCTGGWPDNCYKYYMDAEKLVTTDDHKRPGLMSDKDYAYINKDDPVCHYDSKKALVRIRDWKMVTSYNLDPPMDEEAMQQAVALKGPVSTCFDQFRSLYAYESGIYYDENIDYDDPNEFIGTHCFSIVGYGTDTVDKETGEETKLDYWIAKNSWDADWGEKGFVKMTRNRDNYMRIAMRVSFPIIEEEDEEEDKEEWVKVTSEEINEK